MRVFFQWYILVVSILYAIIFLISSIYIKYMTSSISLNNFDFSSFFRYEKALSTLTPELQHGGLTGYLILGDKIQLAVRDSLTYAKIDIPCDIERSDGRKTVVLFEYQKLLYIIKSYKDTDRSALKICFEHNQVTEETSLTVTTASDTLSLPHRMITNNIETAPFEETSSTDLWNKCIPDKQLFISGLLNCLLFISSDEKKHNAIAVFLDKMIVNDRRHIIVYKNCINTCPTKSQGYLPLHKRAAKIMTLLDDVLVSVKLSQDFAFIKIDCNGAEFLTNNAISNIAPPSSDNLVSLHPVKKAFSVTKEHLVDSTNFFSGFYTAAMEWNPLTVLSDGSSCKLLLKNSGVAGYGACKVERNLTTTELCPDPFEVTIINDSLKQFLSKVRDDSLDIFVDDISPACFLSANDLEIYLVKLV